MTKKEKDFIGEVWEYYRRHGRRSLPWRLTKDPYKILVSEIMLQQTQVDRVIPKYNAFVKRYPTCQKLSQASLGEVLREWQGLGYNRRAKMLHECATIVVRDYLGILPKTYRDLITLPGVGAYTASAVMNFAYNSATPMIETNIRSVYIHYFFKDKPKILDSELMQFIISTTEYEKPRDWFYALMDYGVHIKKLYGNQNVYSKHYIKQKPFKDSDRQIRGLILKLLAHKPVTKKTFSTKLTFDQKRIDEQLKALISEGLVIKVGRTYRLP